MSKRLILAAGALALLLVGLVAGSGPAERLEQRSIDTRFEIRGERPTDAITVIAIDDAFFSGDPVRTWPLPRDLHARAIDILRKAGARQIVYDVQFTEPSAKREDFALFDAVRRARGTILATSEGDASGNTRVLGGDANLARIDAEAGAAALPSEPGGIIRRYPRSVSRLDTLATVVARRLGEPVSGDRFRDGQALIDFAGPSGTIQTRSFGDLLAGRVPTTVLRDRIVVVGVSTPTIQDRFATSVGGDRRMSEPEIQANAIRTALDGNPLQEAAGWMRVGLLILVGGAGVLLVFWLGPLRGAAATVVLGAAFAVAVQVAFSNGVVLPAAVPLAGLIVGAAAAILASVAREMAERRRFAGRNVELEDAVAARTAELEVTHLAAVNRLARAAELRDGDTGEHLERMSRLCELVALELDQTPATARLLRQAAVLHDVGKIGLPDRILNKPGKLEPGEIEEMRRHTTEGAALLDGSSSTLMALAQVVASTHHERWDGTGYPNGLSGDAIPLPGRIAAVCDVFDALITKRSYKHAWTVADARAEIEAQRGRHFDPKVADALLKVIDRPADAPSSEADAGPASVLFHPVRG